MHQSLLVIAQTCKSDYMMTYTLGQISSKFKLAAVDSRSCRAVLVAWRRL